MPLKQLRKTLLLLELGPWASSAATPPTNSGAASCCERTGARHDGARELAGILARSFSGMAFWPQLVLDPEAEIVVDSRGPGGASQKSHWETVVSILSDRPFPVGCRCARPEAHA